MTLLNGLFSMLHCQICPNTAQAFSASIQSNSSSTSILVQKQGGSDVLVYFILLFFHKFPCEWKKLSNKGNEESKHTDLSTERDSGHWMCNRTDSKAAAQIETWEMIIKKKIKLLAGTLECYSLFLNV